MRVLILTISCLCFFLFGQNTFLSEKYDSCDIFDKNDKLVDTVTFQATIKDVIMSPGYASPILVYLEDKKIKRVRDLRYVVDFTIDGCDETFGLPGSDRSEEASSVLQKDFPQKAIITCVIYRYTDIPKIIPAGTYKRVEVIIKVRPAP